VSEALKPRPNRLAAALPPLFMIGLSAAVWFGTSELRIWRGITPGPRFFPMILAGIGALLGVLLLLAQTRGTDAGVTELPDRHGARQVGATLVALFLLALGSPVLGMVPMVALFVLAMLLLVLRQRLLASLSAAVLVALGLQLIFVQWLGVALPPPSLF
jgi:putative tricarboxylic transport membrane protein